MKLERRFDKMIPLSDELIDELTDVELPYAYICPVCHHTTSEHGIEGGHEYYLPVRMKCYHIDKNSIVGYDVIFTQPYTIMNEKIETIKCQCKLDNRCREFDIVSERHKAYQKEFKWRQR